MVTLVSKCFQDYLNYVSKCMFPGTKYFKYTPCFQMFPKHYPAGDSWDPSHTVVILVSRSLRLCELLVVAVCMAQSWCSLCWLRYGEMVPSTSRSTPDVSRKVYQHVPTRLSQSSETEVALFFGAKPQWSRTRRASLHRCHFRLAESAECKVALHPAQRARRRDRFDGRSGRSSHQKSDPEDLGCSTSHFFAP